MWGLDWNALKPAERVLLAVLIVTMVSSVLALLLIAAKLTVEWLNRRDIKTLLKSAHQLLLVDADIRREISRKTDRVERVAEGTQEAIRGLSATAEAVKQAVVPPPMTDSGRLLGDPRRTPVPPSDPESIHGT